MEGGRFFIARADEITFTTHLVLQSRVAAGVHRLGAPRRRVRGPRSGPTSGSYWDQAVYKKPGTESPFPWHQDNGYAFVEPQQYLTCWVALTDATEENGCPWVVPGCTAGAPWPTSTPTSASCACATRRRRGRAGERREHRGLLVADAALDRAEPHRRGAQGLHRAVRAERRRGDPNPAGRVALRVPADDEGRQYEVLPPRRAREPLGRAAGAGHCPGCCGGRASPGRAARRPGADRRARGVRTSASGTGARVGNVALVLVIRCSVMIVMIVMIVMRRLLPVIRSCSGGSCARALGC